MDSAVASNNGKGLLNQMVALVMNDTQVPDRIKKAIEGKVKDRWAAVIDLSDKSGMGALPGGDKQEKGGYQGMDPLDRNSQVRPSQADTGF